MKVLFLGYADCPLIGFLQARGCAVVCRQDKITPEWVVEEGCEFLVSYGYRHLIRKPVLDLFGARAVNLHISLLPWNRGSDPNLWSVIDDTPKGVTIHLLEEGLDTGPILFQRKLEFANSETLASSYAKLRMALEDLFMQSWDALATGSCEATPQPAQGTAHRAADKQDFLQRLPAGFDTPLSEVRRFAQEFFR